MNTRQHLEQLYADRLQWVETSRKNGFEEGIRDLLAEIYPDEAHFIYELLQNAEDARATRVTFDLNRARLVVTHNGRQFNPKDVESITSIGQSSKKDDVNQIGKFGVGFKAVFGYTNTPQIQSGDYRFEIRDLVCPVRLGDGIPDDTTRFVFPFNHREKDPEHAYSETAEGLKKLSDETLLFLNHIREISWFVEEEAASGEIKREPDAENRIRIVRNSTERAAPEISEWLRFQSSIDETGRFDEQGKLNVAIAFRLEERESAESESEQAGAATRKKQIVEADGKLFIFFPAEKETTKLRFHIHGPYASAVDRASIKSSRPENQALLARTADLVATALPKMRDMGLLTADFLAVLPNPEDQLAAFYEPIRQQIVAVMRRDELVPKHGGGHAPAIGLLRGPRRIREVIDAERIGFFASEPGESTNRVRGWAAGVLQNQRPDKFMQSLGIAEWGWNALNKAIEHRFTRHYCYNIDDNKKWLAEQNDEWMQRFYALLDEGFTDLSSWSLKYAEIVRLVSGAHVTGPLAYFPERSSGTGVEGLQRVKREVLEGKNAQRIARARNFLERVGVRTAGEEEELSAILEKYYTAAGGRPSAEEHIVHLRRFVSWWKTTGNTKRFENYTFLVDGPNCCYRQAKELFLDDPYENTGLSVIYTPGDGGSPEKFPIWPKYLEQRIEGFEEFCVAVGVANTLTVKNADVHRNPLFGSHLARSGRYTEYGSQADYDIPGLDALLRRKDAEVSRIVWRTLCRLDKRYLSAYYEPNSRSGTGWAPSQLVIRLQNAEWIPDREGAFHKPADIARYQLPGCFPWDDSNGWLTKIEFGKNVAQREAQRSLENSLRQAAANALKIPLDLATELAELNDEDRAELIRELLSEVRSRKHSQFPVRTPSNPERRKQKVAESAENALDVEYGERRRSVRTTNREAKIAARGYLVDLYNNDDDELICQICEEEMPFKLLNGDYYFEAVEFLDLDREHRENYLALCPTCAAKFRFANATSDEELRESTLEVEDDEVPVSLAHEDWTIRFVETHLIDLRAVLGISAVA
jgi:hypothetical protein